MREEESHLLDTLHPSDSDDDDQEMGALRKVYEVTSNISSDEAASSSGASSNSYQPRHGTPTVDGHAESETLEEARLPRRQQWSSPVWRYIPGPLARASKKTITWAKGPQPPRPWSIKPLFPQIQTFPIRLLDRLAPKWKHRFWLLMALYFCWLLCFVSILHHSAFSDTVPGYGSPSLLSCTDTFWSPKNGCGLDGSDCRPFNGTDFAFRCPASCIKTMVLNPHAVGTQEVNYQPLVIGGPTDLSDPVGTGMYRGDSFICASAIHAGFISDRDGGCGVVSLIGENADFPASRRHRIPSVGFDSNFPLTFSFKPGTRANCKDLRWPLLAVSVIFSGLLSLFTTSPAVFFGSIFSALFFHVALVSDPPSRSDYYSLVSSALAGFLPAAFVAFVIYKFVIKKSLTGLTAQIEKTILWLGPCWVGSLNNYTFDKIPIQRLTPRDIQAQPGAVVALVIIVLVIFVIALGQAWAIRVAGMMPRYLAVYATFIFVLLMFVAVPNMDLRIHHYILALLLLPGTALQNRPSLVYQGLLVGLFINGIARWGFSSILQTPGELLADGQIGSSLPKIDVPEIAGSNITFDYGRIPYPYSAISVLVNDVERFRAYDNETQTYTWTREIEGHPEYFRFGYLSGGTAQDYTKAGIWTSDSTWIPMKSGPSR